MGDTCSLQAKCLEVYKLLLGGFLDDSSEWIIVVMWKMIKIGILNVCNCFLFHCYCSVFVCVTCCALPPRMVLWTVLWCEVLYCALQCCRYWAVLCCAELYCAVVCCAVGAELYCAVLCCTVLCCAVLCWAVLAVLSCAVLSVLCCAVLCCAVCDVLCCAVRCGVVLCCVTLYDLMYAMLSWSWLCSWQFIPQKFLWL